MIIPIATTTPDAPVLVLTSTRRESRSQSMRLARLDNDHWTTVTEFTGKQTSAACLCGQTVLCAALDGHLHAIDLPTGQVRHGTTSITDAEVNAAVAIDDHTAVLAGYAGVGLIFVTLPDLAATRRSLKDYGIDKPGRAVHTLSLSGEKLLLAGLKNLAAAIDLRANTGVELTSRSTFPGKEALGNHIVECAGQIYLSAYLHPDNGLFHLHDKTASPVPLPFTPDGSIGLSTWNGQLLLWRKTIHVGQPDDWQPFCPDFSADIALVRPMPHPDTLLALTSTGKAFLLTPDRATPVLA